MADAQQRGMGRGLSAILPRGGKVDDGLRDIPLDLIQPNARQPRQTFDQARLAELASRSGPAGCSSRSSSAPLAGGTFELIAGERRLRAAQMVELPTIPALVRDTDDWERLDLALAENMARVDLNPVEEARACAMLVDDLGLTKQEVGRRVGRSRVAISNLIRLLELPEEALELIERSELTEGHGRALLLLQGPRRTVAASRSRPATAPGRCARPSVARARQRANPSRRRSASRASSIRIWPRPWPRPRTPSSAALRPAREGPRQRRPGCRVELDFDSPAEAVALAERILARGHLRAA